MYLIITSFAAILTTIIWYFIKSENKNSFGKLCLIYWGASLMWLVDRIIACFSEGEAFFELTLNATLLGILVVFVGFVAWLILTRFGILRKLKS